MQLTEQHVIDRHDPRFAPIHHACWLSKNLYNRANYIRRQAFIHEGRVVNYYELAKLLQDAPDYCALPRRVSQQVLMQLDRNWTAFFEAHKAWRAQPDQFKGEPRIPHYKDTAHGRNLLIYTDQAISKVALREGWIAPSGLDIRVKTKQAEVDQVRIVSRGTHYVVEVVYTVPEPPLPETPERLAGVDVSVNNLAAVTSNQASFRPFLVNGRPLKALNQFYNKRRAQLQSQLPSNRKTSKQLQAITDKRNRRIHHYLHCASCAIVQELTSHDIDTLIIGK